MNDRSLYYIAVIPPVKESNSIQQIKEDLKTRFNICHSLRSPAHITLQMPFRRNIRDENDIMNSLKEFAAAQPGFDVFLDGFGHFSNRVIFIKIQEHSPFIDLRQALACTLRLSLNFTENETSGPYHPHITIAHRDLSPEIFNIAWSEFRFKQFTATFRITSLSLLKHDGKKWNIYRSFPFKLL